MNICVFSAIHLSNDMCNSTLHLDNPSSNSSIYLVVKNGDRQVTWKGHESTSPSSPLAGSFNNGHSDTSKFSLISAPSRNEITFNPCQVRVNAPSGQRIQVSSYFFPSHLFPRQNQVISSTLSNTDDKSLDSPVFNDLLADWFASLFQRTRTPASCVSDVLFAEYERRHVTSLCPGRTPREDENFFSVGKEIDLTFWRNYAQSTQAWNEISSEEINGKAAIDETIDRHYRNYHRDRNSSGWKSKMSYSTIEWILILKITGLKYFIAS